jgi:hypothetical protein
VSTAETARSQSKAESGKMASHDVVGNLLERAIAGTWHTQVPFECMSVKYEFSHHSTGYFGEDREKMKGIVPAEPPTNPLTYACYFIQ